MRSEVSFKFASTSAHQCCIDLQVNSDTGLPSQQVRERLKKHAANELELMEKESLVSRFVEQFKNPLIILLMVSALVSTLLGQISDAISIMLTILIVLTVSFVQEYQASQSLEALNKLAPPHCHVLRFTRFNVQGEPYSRYRSTGARTR